MGELGIMLWLCGMIYMCIHVCTYMMDNMILW